MLILYERIWSERMLFYPCLHTTHNDVQNVWNNELAKRISFHGRIFI